MATKLEEITQVLQQVREEDIEIIHLNGEVVIHVKTTVNQTPVESKKGKWARVAENMGEENLLGDGRGEHLRESIRKFRDHFRFRDVFADS